MLNNQAKANCVGIDARKLGGTGIGTAIEGLLKALNKISTSDFAYTIFHQPEGKSRLRGLGLSTDRFTFVETRIKPFSWQEQILWPKLLKKYNLDLFHVPHCNIPLLYEGRMLVTLHDLIPLYFSVEMSRFGLWYYRLLNAHAMRKATAVITVSDFTKSDLLRDFPVNAHKINVIYNGVDNIFGMEFTNEEVNAIREKYKLPERFIFYVGLHKAHKGLDYIYQALRRLREERKLTIPLVMLSRWKPEEETGIHALRKKLGITTQIIDLPAVADNTDLAKLYRAAEMLVFPSLYEGFGLPVLEAMSAGTAVVAFDIPAVREVAQECALLIPKGNVPELVQGIAKLWEDKRQREMWGGKGQERARFFTWNANAVSTIELYRRCLR